MLPTSMLDQSQVLTALKRKQTCTLRIYSQAKINLTRARNNFAMPLQRELMHELCAEVNCSHGACIFFTGEVHSKTVSGPFQIYLGLGVHGCGHGTCQRSLSLSLSLPLFNIGNNEHAHLSIEHVSRNKFATMSKHTWVFSSRCS
jgi:hypothetical protein